jgi:uncharacterized membrane protein
MHNLNQENIKQIESRIKQFEEQTGCELLLVVAKNSDPYPAASLRFGVVSSFLTTLIFSYYFEFHHQASWPISILILTVIFTWLGGFSWAKKLALSSWETKRECREKAIECFHSLGTTQVDHKVTAMIMISLLEKRIEILVDQKIKQKVSENDLNDLIHLMLSDFKNNNFSSGLIKSIECLEKKILTSFSGKVAENSPEKLSNTIHFLNF